MKNADKEILLGVLETAISNEVERLRKNTSCKNPFYLNELIDIYKQFYAEIFKPKKNCKYYDELINVYEIGLQVALNRIEYYCDGLEHVDI